MRLPLCVQPFALRKVCPMSDDERYDGEERLASIKEKWRFAFDLPRSALWGESDVKWMLAEIDRLHAELKQLRKGERA